MKTRSRVRVVSYLTAMVAVLGGFVASGYLKAAEYRTQLEYSYQRSLIDLADQVSDISVTLEKSVYAGTPSQLELLSAKLLRDCGAANSSLSRLPLSDIRLDNTYKFISQAGEYAMSLTKKVSRSEEITLEEKENLVKLSNYSKGLTEHINTMENDIEKGNMTIGEVAKAVAAQSQESGDTPQVDNGFRDMEDSFEGYPTLIYDGPYSDKLMQREPIMTKNKSEVSKEDARRKAADAMGVDVSKVADDSDEAGKMPSYCFKSDDMRAAVTKRGGYLSYMVNGRAVDVAKISVEDACKKAEEYLGKLGYNSMAKSYHETANNICTINFAYDVNGVICYTDLIKVGVALDTGEVVSIDARGFIVNHYDREIAKPTVTMDEAKAVVSKQLKPGEVRLCVIPTDGLNEVLAYEVRCKGQNNENILVYINALTKAEEQILILIETESGTLTY